MKKLTQQAVESYCLERGYRVLSPYVNSRTKIKLQNVKTGEIGEMRFSDFKQGSRFDNYRNYRKFTQKEVESYCESQGYKVLSEYIDSLIKIKLQNIETGEIGEMMFSSFKNGRRFDNPKAKTKFTQQEVEEHCLEHGYKVLSEYVNSNTKIKLQNIETHIIGEMTFSSFKQGSRFDNPKVQKITYKEYIRPFIDESYTVLIDEKDYKNINAKTKINVMCPNNHKWSNATRSHFTTSNRRCPMCNQNVLGGMSVGEKMVYQILQGNNINFEREKSVYIDDKLYRFDFYFEVELFNSIEKFIIEYDGEQHYIKRGIFGKFDQRRESDEIKDEYAHDNNIQMVRIPWTNNTIDKILFIINGETGLNLKKVDVDLPTKQVVADYYLSHDNKETMDKFNISVQSVNRYFNQIYGTNKTEYLGTSRQLTIG